MSKISPSVADILTASPNQLVLYVYNAAIAACERGDAPRTREAIQELDNALNYEASPDLAAKFHDLYAQMRDNLDVGKYEPVLKCLTDLRGQFERTVNS